MIYEQKLELLAIGIKGRTQCFLIKNRKLLHLSYISSFSSNDGKMSSSNSTAYLGKMF